MYIHTYIYSRHELNSKYVEILTKCKQNLKSQMKVATAGFGNVSHT